MIGLFYNFPAIKGVQANEEYYSCMIPLSLLSKIFLDTDNDVLPEYRAQRKLNENRIPSITRYILDNRDSYVFSALAASVDGNMEFICDKSNENIGILKIDMNAKILINDGQHRKAALLKAINEDETLLNETICVVLFKDKGLKRSQQMFTDLNKHAVNTSKSLNALYDSKDISSIISKEVVKNVDFLNRYTDKERDNLGKYSSKLFTLNNIVNANKKVIKVCYENITNNQIIQYLSYFWEKVTRNINEFNELNDKELTKKDLRENYIITQGVTIQAIGLLAAYFVEYNIKNIDEYIERLRLIDWSRTNSEWIGAAIKINGRINMSKSGINATYIKIKELINLPLTKIEKNEMKRIKKYDK